MVLGDDVVDPSHFLGTVGLPSADLEALLAEVPQNAVDDVQEAAEQDQCQSCLRRAPLVLLSFTASSTSLTKKIQANIVLACSVRANTRESMSIPIRVGIGRRR